MTLWRYRWSRGHFLQQSSVSSLARVGGFTGSAQRRSLIALEGWIGHLDKLVHFLYCERCSAKAAELR